MILPSKLQLENALKRNPWDFSNSILYDLCKNNFNHTEDEIIITKILFIGRIYAAAVERRKNKKEEINDNFYLKTVAPTLKKSNIDKELNELKKENQITIENIHSILVAHNQLTTILKSITDLEKRSLSSKYLHFHLPELFFIYDSRANNALRNFVNKVPKELKHIADSTSVDKEYAKFFCKSYALKKEIEREYGIIITNRQLDNILIETANNEMIEKGTRI